METSWLFHLIEWLALLFIFALGPLALLGVIIFTCDKLQTRNAITHNYPIVGHFRSFFIQLGEFFRQYFFAMDREEMPFNRAYRNWVDRASSNVDNTVAFGSTKNLTPAGTFIFVNCPFPTLDTEATKAASMLIGPYCREPYTTESFFNISGMSYGAISKPAVQALSKGPKGKEAAISATGSLFAQPHLINQPPFLLKIRQL